MTGSCSSAPSSSGTARSPTATAAQCSSSTSGAPLVTTRSPRSGRAASSTTTVISFRSGRHGLQCRHCLLGSRLLHEPQHGVGDHDGRDHDRVERPALGALQDPGQGRDGDGEEEQVDQRVPELPQDPAPRGVRGRGGQLVGPPPLVSVSSLRRGQPVLEVGAQPGGEHVGVQQGGRERVQRLLSRSLPDPLHAVPLSPSAAGPDGRRRRWPPPPVPRRRRRAGRRAPSRARGSGGPRPGSSRRATTGHSRPGSRSAAGTR